MDVYALSCGIWSVPNLVDGWELKWEQIYRWIDRSLWFLLKSSNPNYFQMPGIRISKRWEVVLQYVIICLCWSPLFHFQKLKCLQIRKSPHWWTITVWKICEYVDYKSRRKLDFSSMSIISSRQIYGSLIHDNIPHIPPRMRWLIGYTYVMNGW